YNARRTWDPETGWELFNVTTGPDYPTFELRHPSRGTIKFQGETVSSTKTGERTSEGYPMRHAVFRVFFLNGRTRDAHDEQKRFIAEALNAYGASHNGPTGPVDVIYDE